MLSPCFELLLRCYILFTIQESSKKDKKSVSIKPQDNLKIPNIEQHLMELHEKSNGKVCHKNQRNAILFPCYTGDIINIIGLS